MTFDHYENFWGFYVLEHRKKATRIWHFIGTSGVFMFILLALILQNALYILGAPIFAYGMAWVSHFFIEGNKPATFGHPFWSLRADFRMYRYILLGKMNQEVKKYEAKQSTEAAL